jgi:phosphoenolpyruvate carboxylase
MEAEMASKHKSRKWSAEVTKHSNALDLKRDIFKKSPKQIAQSLKQSAEHSHRRKSSPYRSAMSMLTFYLNRAGKNLSQTRRKKLEAAKGELREAFGRAK